MRSGTLGFTLVADCPECGRGQLRVRTRRSDGEPFLSCSRFPQCRCAMAYVDGLAEVYAELFALRLEVRPLQAQDIAAPVGGHEAALAIRELLVRFHPDRRGATIDTIEVAQHLGAIYNRLKGAAR